MKNKYAVSIVSVVLMLFIASTVYAAEELVDLSLEELLNMTVTSATGRQQKMSDVSNAMYVITREDIERSGARNIPDLFYKVPGMQVRRIDGRRYFVSIRRQGGIGTNSLLVLLDGVVVFNPVNITGNSV